MTQEDKQLLLVDLCTRLPYGVICKNRISGRTAFLPDITIESFMTNIEFLQPYLRPLSSMTVEEKLKFTDDVAPHDSVVFCNEVVHIPMNDPISQSLSYEYLAKIINWLNAHHFDYRGLIEKGLAIEVTKSNNPYKD